MPKNGALFMDTIDKINYHLVKKGKTGADLSRALGLSNSVYSQWNTGKTRPRKSKLIAIADYLGVSVADLMPDGENLPQENIKKEATNTGDLSDAELRLIELFRKLPAETQSSFPALLEATLKAQGLL